MSGTSHLSEKERPTGEPGAKVAGMHGVAPRDEGRSISYGEQSTKTRGTVRAASRGTLPFTSMRNLYAPEAHHSSALRPLTTQELTKQVQCVVLSFPSRDVVDDTQASIRAIENVRNGESGMSLKTFVNLCRANARARAMVAPLLGYGDESDPNVVQAISVLLNQLVRPEGPDTEVRNDGRSPQGPSGDGELSDGDSQSAVGDLFGGPQ